MSDLPDSAPIRTPEEQARRRRQWLLTSGAVVAGLAAMGAGIGVARKRQPPAPPPLPGEALPADFWSRAFEQPNGQQLDWAGLKGHPMLINFWATWCAPCVKELPEIERFHQTYSPQGWRVVGLAIDSPTPVRDFLTKTHLSFPIGLAGLQGSDLASALGNKAGVLPFSVLIDANGRIRQRKLGATHFDELQGWTQQLA